MSTTTKRRRAAARTSGHAQRRLAEQRAAHRRRLLFFGGAVGVAIVAVVVLIAINRETASGFPAIVPAASAIEASIPRSGNVLGDPNAPVTLTEWGDYQCPACAVFQRTFMPRLVEEYVKTGMVKIEFKNFPFLDDRSGSGESDLPAEAAACAADQNTFWEFHETIYGNQYGENEGNYSKKRLQQIAGAAGLDTARFGQCFDDRTHRQAVQTVAAEGEAAGINSTPSLLIDGALVPYTGSYDDLKLALDQALGR